MDEKQINTVSRKSRRLAFNGSVKGKDVPMLVDGGADGDFIDEGLVAKLEL